MQTTTISAQIFGEEVDLTIQDIRIGMLSDQGYRRVQMQTEEGAIECHYYGARYAKKAVIFVGGEENDFDSPGQNVYPRLATELTKWQINCLHIRFRDALDIGEAILDVLAGINFLQSDRIQSIGLVGHSFGGAVVIQVAAAIPTISTIVALAPQNFGAEAIAQFDMKQSLLLLHGRKDDVLPALSSATLYQLAHEPKDIFFYKNATHNFDETANEVYEKTKSWLLSHV